MHNVIEFAVADLNLPKTQPRMMAELVRDRFDGKDPVRTLDGANHPKWHDHSAKSPLHAAGKRGLRPCSAL